MLLQDFPIFRSAKQVSVRGLPAPEKYFNLLATIPARQES